MISMLILLICLSFFVIPLLAENEEKYQIIEPRVDCEDISFCHKINLRFKAFGLLFSVSLHRDYQWVPSYYSPKSDDKQLPKECHHFSGRSQFWAEIAFCGNQVNGVFAKIGGKNKGRQVFRVFFDGKRKEHLIIWKEGLVSRRVTSLLEDDRSEKMRQKREDADEKNGATAKTTEATESVTPTCSHNWWLISIIVVLSLALLLVVFLFCCLLVKYRMNRKRVKEKLNEKKGNEKKVKPKTSKHSVLDIVQPKDEDQPQDSVMTVTSVKTAPFSCSEKGTKIIDYEIKSGAGSAETLNK